MGTGAPRSTPGESDSTSARFAASRELQRALAPWIDADTIDWKGFEAWLLTVLPLLPRPGSNAVPAKDERIRALSLALVEAARDRAVSHFQASEYFRDNQMLSRRVKALEAILEVGRKRGLQAVEQELGAGSDRTTERYLPGKRSPGTRTSGGA